MKVGKMKKRILALTLAILIAAFAAADALANEEGNDFLIDRPYAQMLLNLCTAIREKGYESADLYTPEQAASDDSIRPETEAYLYTKWVDAGQGGSDLTETLFALMDLNGDGVRELAISAQSDNLDLFCTVEEGEVRILAAYAYRNTAKICGKYIVTESATIGDDYVFAAAALSDRGELEAADGFVKQKDEDDQTVYLLLDETPITEAAAMKLREKYLAGAGPQWYRLLDYEAVFKEASDTPNLKSIQNAFGGVKIGWDALEGAGQYRVFRKTPDRAEWIAIGDTDQLSFFDEAVLSGTQYVYTVRAVSADGKSYTSSFDNIGKQITYIAAPKLLSAQNTAGGILLQWEKSSGAENYRIFRKSGGAENWQRLTDTAEESYLDPYVEAGKDYVYTVRAVSADGSSYQSSYDPEGAAIRCQPADNTESPSDENIAISDKESSDPSVPPDKGGAARIWLLTGGGILIAALVLFLIIRNNQKKEPAD